MNILGGSKQRERKYFCQYNCGKKYANEQSRRQHHRHAHNERGRVAVRKKQRHSGGGTKLVPLTSRFADGTIATSDDGSGSNNDSGSNLIVGNGECVPITKSSSMPNLNVKHAYRHSVDDIKPLSHLQPRSSFENPYEQLEQLRQVQRLQQLEFKEKEEEILRKQRALTDAIIDQNLPKYNNNTHAHPLTRSFSLQTLGGTGMLPSVAENMDIANYNSMSRLKQSPSMEFGRSISGGGGNTGGGLMHSQSMEFGSLSNNINNNSFSNIATTNNNNYTTTNNSNNSGNNNGIPTASPLSVSRLSSQSFDYENASQSNVTFQNNNNNTNNNDSGMLFSHHHQIPVHRSVSLANLNSYPGALFPQQQQNRQSSSSPPQQQQQQQQQHTPMNRKVSSTDQLAFSFEQSLSFNKSLHHSQPLTRSVSLADVYLPKLETNSNYSNTSINSFDNSSNDSNNNNNNNNSNNNNSNNIDNIDNNIDFGNANVYSNNDNNGVYNNSNANNSNNNSLNNNNNNNIIGNTTSSPNNNLTMGGMKSFSMDSLTELTVDFDQMMQSDFNPRSPSPLASGVVFEDGGLSSPSLDFIDISSLSLENFNDHGDLLGDNSNNPNLYNSSPTSNNMNNMNNNNNNNNNVANNFNVNLGNGTINGSQDMLFGF